MPRSAADIETELNAINAEITRQITSGSAYSAEGRSMQRVEFRELVRHRDALQALLDRATSPGGSTAYIVVESG